LSFGEPTAGCQCVFLAPANGIVAFRAGPANGALATGVALVASEVASQPTGCQRFCLCIKSVYA